MVMLLDGAKELAQDSWGSGLKWRKKRRQCALNGPVQRGGVLKERVKGRDREREAREKEEKRKPSQVSCKLGMLQDKCNCKALCQAHKAPFIRAETRDARLE